MHPHAFRLGRFPLPIMFIVFGFLVSPLWGQTTQEDQPPPPSPLPTPAMESGEASAVRVDAADHETLQAAIDALPAAGGVVKIPPGVFELSEPLVVRTGDTRIEGSGTATQIRNANTEGAAAFMIRPDDLETEPRARLWRVELCDLRITGNKDSGVGIDVVGVQEFVLRNLSVDRNGSHGIRMEKCLENPRVIGCNLTYNNGSGLHLLGGHDIVVNANQFEENLDAVTLLDGFNLTFTGNNVDDHLRHGVVVENSYGSEISSNMIEECAGSAVVLDRDCYGIAISGNAIAHHLGGGVDLRDAWGCTVTGNNFVLVHEFSVRVGENSGRHTITGNQFTNSYIGEGKLRRSDGIDAEQPWRKDVCAGVVLEETEDVLISANQFSGLTTRAVEARGACRRLLVTNNVVTDHGRGLPPGTAPINVESATESVVEPNVISEPSTEADR